MAMTARNAISRRGNVVANLPKLQFNAGTSGIIIKFDVARVEIPVRCCVCQCLGADLRDLGTFGKTLGLFDIFSTASWSRKQPPSRKCN
jgi:hypothetical protein